MDVRDAVLSVFSGIVFGVGLVVSGMTQPGKVIGFLDFAGDWDPALAFVMGGAVAVHAVAYVIQRRSDGPWLQSGGWRLPRRQDIDPRLLGGAALFGVGWALSGYCPGPAVVTTPTLAYDIVVFMPSMLLGMLLYRVIDGWGSARRVAPTDGVTT